MDFNRFFGWLPPNPEIEVYSSGYPLERTHPDYIELDTVTIYIDGHGEATIDPLRKKEVTDILLLSAAGLPGKFNFLQQCNGVNISFILKDYIHERYKDSEELQDNLMVGMDADLRTVVHEETPEIIPLLANGGYILTRPETNRYYSFKPEEGECETFNQRCNTDRKNISSYGITVVASSNVVDREFTLQGVDLKDDKTANMNQNPHALEHWKERAHLGNPFQPELIDGIIGIIEGGGIYLNQIIFILECAGFINIRVVDMSCRGLPGVVYDSTQRFGQSPSTIRQRLWHAYEAVRERIKPKKSFVKTVKKAYEISRHKKDLEETKQFVEEKTKQFNEKTRWKGKTLHFLLDGNPSKGIIRDKYKSGFKVDLLINDKISRKNLSIEYSQIIRHSKGGKNKITRKKSIKKVASKKNRRNKTFY